MPTALGPFRVSRVVGEGGSATVYAARRGEETFALKVLKSDLALSERERRRFLEEAALLRRVEHPAIVRLVDAGTLEDGTPYLVMPLLEGGTLAERLREGPLTLPFALETFATLADALSAIHARGLVHRDIKPENVFLGDDGPVLLDLGIARDATDGVSTTTEQGRIRGTPAYMAPERFFGVSASVETDIYELGVVLYVMLVSALPWSESDRATSRLHPRPPSEVGVVLPEALETVVLRALSTRPEMRPPSASAFAEQVRLAVVAPVVAPGEPSEARARSEIPPPRPAPRRFRLAIGGAMAVLGASAVVAFSRFGAPPPARAPSASAQESPASPPGGPKATPSVEAAFEPARAGEASHAERGSVRGAPTATANRGAPARSAATHPAPAASAPSASGASGASGASSAAVVTPSEGAPPPDPTARFFKDRK